MRQMEKPVWLKELELRERMLEFLTYGSVGEALGNRCLYPEYRFCLRLYFSPEGYLVFVAICQGIMVIFNHLNKDL